MKKIGIIFSIITILLFIGLLAKSLQFNPNKRENPLVGKLAADFSVESLKEGEEAVKLSLGQYKGKPIVLNFWASWCHSCREESHEVEAFWQKYKEQGLVVFGVSVQDERDEALKFIQMAGKTYVLGLDVTGEASVQYGLTGVPETFFIDRHGVIKHKINGPVSMKLLEEFARSIL